jgi:hypothetical protein
MAVTTSQVGSNVVFNVSGAETFTVLSVNANTGVLSSAVLPAGILAEAQKQLREMAASVTITNYSLLASALIQLTPLEGGFFEAGLAGAPPVIDFTVTTAGATKIIFQLPHTIPGGYATAEFLVWNTFSSLTAGIAAITPKTSALVQGSDGALLAQPVGSLDIADFARTAAGTYEIAIGAGFTQVTATASIADVASGPGFVVARQNGGDPTKVDVLTFDTAGVAADLDFAITIYAA